MYKTEALDTGPMTITKHTLNYFAKNVMKFN